METLLVPPPQEVLHDAAAQQAAAAEAQAASAPAFTPESPAPFTPQPGAELPAPTAAEASAEHSTPGFLRKIGGAVTSLYNSTKFGVGMAMAGLKNEKAPAAIPASAPAEAGWAHKVGNVAEKATKVIKGGALLALGGAALKVMASHHGMDAGGNGGNMSLHEVANTTSMADGSSNAGEIAAGVVLATGVAGTLGIMGLVRRSNKTMPTRSNRADVAKRRTRPQPNGDPAAQDRVRDAQGNANREDASKQRNRRNGAPIAPALGSADLGIFGYGKGTPVEKHILGPDGAILHEAPAPRNPRNRRYRKP